MNENNFHDIMVNHLQVGIRRIYALLSTSLKAKHAKQFKSLTSDDTRNLELLNLSVYLNKLIGELK